MIHLYYKDKKGNELWIPACARMKIRSAGKTAGRAGMTKRGGNDG